jgi:hypothetical protein
MNNDDGDKFAPDDSGRDDVEALILRLREQRNILLRAAIDALALLKKGAPGWGVAKDLLNAAIHKATDNCR